MVLSRMVLAIPLLLMSAACAGDVVLPVSADTVSYSRKAPVYKNTAIPKAIGDAILDALAGGQALSLPAPPPPDIICVLYPSPSRFITIQLHHGASQEIAFAGTRMVYLGYSPYIVSADAEKKLEAALVALEAELVKEITSAPRPMTYPVYMLNDGGTLSGIARLFYGDASKWNVIYEANRSTIKDPNVIQPGMKLTIPKLP